MDKTILGRNNRGKGAHSSDGITPPISKWVELETLTARLVSLFPGADSVKHNVRLRGKSGIKRQIDILLEKAIGPIQLKVIFDTKRRRTPIRRTDVLAVQDIKKDVGANLAVVVAPHGFDRGAKEFADANGIQLLKSINTDDPSWLGKLVLPVSFDLRFLIYVTDANFPESAVTSLVKELQRWWESGQLPKDLDRSSASFAIGCGRDGLIEYETFVTLQELRYFRYRRFPLRFFGLYKQETKTFATDRMSTEGISISELVATPFNAKDFPGGSSCVPLSLRFIQRGTRQKKKVKIMIKDSLIHMALLPKEAILDLSPERSEIPFQISITPLA